MKLKQEISPSLYRAICDKYENGLYRDAVLATLFHLNRQILAQANLNQAISLATSDTLLALFGGTDPAVKLNNMTTLAQILEQIGFGQMLLGLYHGIKYPRIHADDTFDDQRSANAIIIFIDYLLTRLEHQTE